MNKGPHGKTISTPDSKALVCDLSDESQSDSNSGVAHGIAREEKKLGGDVFLEGIGWVHYSQVPNGALYDFGADVFSEMFGSPEEDTEVASETTYDDNEPRVVSTREVLCEMYSHIKEQGKSFFQSFKNINVFGPKHIPEDDEKSSSDLNYK